MMLVPPSVPRLMPAIPPTILLPRTVSLLSAAMTSPCALPLAGLSVPVAVFTPIAPLRAILAGFFQVLMRNGNAVLHIGVCLLLSAALSLVGLAVLKRKTL